MKNNHIHLKRLAAISLCLVMCLSALPMLVPTAAAADVLDDEGMTKGIISMSMDDGALSHYIHAYRILSEHDLVATCYVPRNVVGSGSAMSWEQLQELQAAGWEIGAHGMTHSIMTTLDAASLTYELATPISEFADHGITITTMAYPGGHYNATVLAEAKNYYSVTNGIAQTRMGYTPEMLSLCDRVILRVGVGAATTTDVMKQWVDLAVNEKKWVQIFWHDVAEDGTIGESNGAQLDDLAAYIAGQVAAGQLDVMTVRDAWDHMDGEFWSSQRMSSGHSNPAALSITSDYRAYSVSKDNLLGSSIIREIDPYYHIVSWDGHSATNSSQADNLAYSGLPNREGFVNGEMSLGQTYWHGRQATAFDGVDDSILFSNLPKQDAGSLLLTFERERASVNEWMLHMSYLPTVILTDDGMIRVLFNGATGMPVDGDYTNKYQCPAGTYDLAFIWDNSTGSYALWLNGVLLESRTGCTFPASSDAVALGGATDGRFKGVIGQFHYLSLPMSAEQYRTWHRETTYAQVMSYTDYVYHVTADQDVTEYTLTTDAKGLSIDDNGRVSGVIEEAGYYYVNITARNTQGVTWLHYTLFVSENPNPPIVAPSTIGAIYGAISAVIVLGVVGAMIAMVGRLKF